MLRLKKKLEVVPAGGPQLVLSLLEDFITADTVAAKMHQDDRVG
jgi:hypothetical protein